MRLPSILLLTAAAVESVNAQSQEILTLIAGLPSCSLSCLTSALSASGCTIRDMTCSCGAQRANITAAATPCVAAACTAAELATVKSNTGEVCVLFDAAVASSASVSATAISSSAPSSPTTAAMATSSASVATVSTLSPSSTSATRSGSTRLSGAARAGIGIAVAFVGAVVLGALGCCVLGARRRRRDLGYLGWIEKRGVVAGRTELEARESVEMGGVGVEESVLQEGSGTSVTSGSAGRRNEGVKKQGG